MWDDHCQDKSVLSVYAESMMSLAQDYWTKNVQTRIDWCQDTMVEYFFTGGLKKTKERDKKKKLQKLRENQEPQRCYDLKLKEHFEGQTGISNTKSIYMVLSKGGTDCGKCADVSGGLTVEDKTAEKFGPASGEDGGHNLSTSPALDKLHTTKDESFTHIQLPFEGRIRLLDVGSCYNPFLRWDHFLTVAIDISPATETVLKCDFLKLDVSPALELPAADVENHLTGLTSPVGSLPACSFHAVIFSLLLEYMPSPAQRWMCCVKAYQLLQYSGLLVIVTPDSHSQHRNAPMIRSWKTALEALGFFRWRYVKLQHLHCMAFRKMPPECCSFSVPECKQHFGSGSQQPEKQSMAERLEKDFVCSDQSQHHLSLRCARQRHDDFADLMQFSDFMYIPQDFSDPLHEEEGKDENENAREARFMSEEERQGFFLAVGDELPGLSSEDDI